MAGNVEPATQKCPTGQIPPIPVFVPVGDDISTPINKKPKTCQCKPANTHKKN